MWRLAGVLNADSAGTLKLPWQSPGIHPQRDGFRNVPLPLGSSSLFVPEVQDASGSVPVILFRVDVFFELVPFNLMLLRQIKLARSSGPLPGASRGRRSVWRCAVGLLPWLLAIPVFAAPPPESSPAGTTFISPQDPQVFVHVSVRQPIRVVEHPWLMGIWQSLRSSPTFRASTTASLAEGLLKGGEFLRQVSGEPWEKSFARLTSEGIEFSLWRRNPRPAAATASREAGLEPTPIAAVLVIRGSDEGLLRKVLAATEHDRNPAGSPLSGVKGDNAISRYTYRGVRCARVPSASGLPAPHYATIGARFLLSTDEVLLRELLDRALAEPKRGAKSQATGSADRSLKTGDVPLLEFSARLGELRELPQWQSLLPLPTQYVSGALLLELGDVLRRAERVQGSLRLEPSGVAMHWEFAAGLRGMNQGIRDSLATQGGAFPPPLPFRRTAGGLQTQRDLALAWQHRQVWLSPSGAERVLGWEQQGRERIAGLEPLKGIAALGSHWQLAVALPAEAPAVERDRRRTRFPDIGLTVDVRDEPALRRTVIEPLETYLRSPVAKTLGTFESEEFRGTRISIWKPSTQEFHRPRLPESAPRRDGLPHEHSPRAGSAREIPRAGNSSAVPPVSDRAAAPPAKKTTALPKPGAPVPHAEKGRGEGTRRDGLRTGSTGRHHHHGWGLYRGLHVAYAVHRGHLLLGTTAAVVRQMVENWNPQSAMPPGTPGVQGAERAAGETSGTLSFSLVAEHLRARARLLQRRLVLSSGLTEEQAKAEFDAFQAVLLQLGDLSFRESLTEDALRLEFHIGTSASVSAP